MKKVYILLFLVFFAIIYLIRINTTVYFYIHPHTNISTLKYITPAIRELDKVLKYAERSVRQDGKDIKYLYYNAYGSGFLEGNPIPNDLDYAIGVYLGEYEYDGTNGDKIAEEIVDKMNAFDCSFLYYLNTQKNKKIFSINSTLQKYADLKKNYDIHTNSIKNALDKAISGKSYVVYTKREVFSADKGIIMDVPYRVEPYEILLEKRFQHETYSDLVKYNESQPKYLREISISPHFYSKIKYQNKDYNIKFTPEGKFANMYRLSGHMFVPIVFVHSSSEKFLKELPELNNDYEFINGIYYSYKKHYLPLNNFRAYDIISVKYLKRLLQVAETTEQIVPEDDYIYIKAQIGKNLSNENVRLLNEFNNVLKTIESVLSNIYMFNMLKQQNKLVSLHLITKNLYQIMSEKDFLNHEDLTILKNTVDFIDKLDNIENSAEYVEFFKEFENDIKPKISAVLSKNTEENINIKDSSISYLREIDDIYKSAGYHNVDLYWLDNNTMGIIKNDFTKSIDDLDKFAKDNNLPNVKFKLIEQSKAPVLAIRYEVPVRFNSSEEENKRAKELNALVIKSKKNYNIKRKFVLFNTFVF